MTECIPLTFLISIVVRVGSVNISHTGQPPVFHNLGCSASTNLRLPDSINKDGAFSVIQVPDEESRDLGTVSASLTVKTSAVAHQQSGLPAGEEYKVSTNKDWLRDALGFHAMEMEKSESGWKSHSCETWSKDSVDKFGSSSQSPTTLRWLSSGTSQPQFHNDNNKLMVPFIDFMGVGTRR
eukprot:c27710_g1_i1 orf=195-737(+)